MEKLTKEQKLEMVSKAIDAGFSIHLNHYSVKSDEELNNSLSVFKKGLERKIRTPRETKNGDVWININSDNEYEDKFSATIFIDSLRGDSSD